MNTPLRLLLVEDSDKDVALEVKALKAADYQVTYVVAVTAAEMKAALAEQAFDIVISDHDLPQFDAPGALAELKQSGQDIPFIIVSGVIGEGIAVALMKAGAHDYVMKDKLTRLVPAVQRELREAESRRERKRAEEELNKAKTLLDKIFTSMEEAIFVVDSKTRRIIACNHATEVIFGFGVKDIIGCRTAILHVDKLSYDLFGQKLFPALDANGVFRTEFQMRRKDGSVFPAEHTVTEILNDVGHRTSVVSVIRDITDRKMAENKLTQANRFLDSIIENIPNVIFLKDARDLRYIRVNRAGENLLGYSRDDLLGRSDYDFFPKEQADHFTKKDREVLNEKEIVDIPEETVQTRSKGERTIHTKKVPLLNEKGEPEFLLGISEDISERKKNEEQIKDLHEQEQIILDASPAMIFYKDKENRFIRVNASMAKANGMSKEEMEGKTCWDIFPREAANSYWQNDKEVLADKKPLLNIIEEMKTPKGTMWVQTDKIPYRNSKGEIIGIIGFVLDITERKQAEEKLKDTLQSLRKAVGTTIQVMVSAVEARDPYTAGHQVRSADLARAIATEMGLRKENIDGIRIAASIHDIGKLSIPAEILSKPTKLSEIEFTLIKEHSRSGHEILKEVESPWSLAEIIYQHHERMDGSGYPRNLKGEEICIEARILAVSDVVEAMASHRPYRPALGVDAAIEEISKNRGILYDLEVADACLKLFHERRYNFDEFEIVALLPP